MTTTPHSNIEKNLGQLIHVGKYFSHPPSFTYLFLRKKDERTFIWSEETDNVEKETSVIGSSIEEAILLANKYWKNKAFFTLNCGFRYTLPERDEHGINAYFYQMIASSSSINGVYYDETLGNNCFVQNSSDEAYRLGQYLKNQNRL